MANVAERFRIDWATPVGRLAALEPTISEVMRHADALSAAYNDPHNAALMGHTEPMSTDDVIEHYAEMIEGGQRVFLLFADDELAGDADLRGFSHAAGDPEATAEFAFMIAARAAQGKGLGTRFATMIHAFGFVTLELARIYAPVVPGNTASLRVFEKLGHAVDASPAARDFADDDTDVVMSVDRATFEAAATTSALADIRVTPRSA